MYIHEALVTFAGDFLFALKDMFGNNEREWWRHTTGPDNSFKL